MKSAQAGDVNHSQAPRWYLPALLGFAFVVRSLYLLGYRHDPLSQHLLHDARRYHDWATAMAAGEVWESGAFYQAPLYPTLLGLVYRLTVPNPWVVYALQALLGTCAVWLVWRVADRSYGQPAAMIAATLTSLYLPLIFFDTKVLGASLAVFLTTLLIDRMQAADLSASDWIWIVPGLVAGLAALVNPSLLLAGLLATLWILLDRARSRQHRLRRAIWIVAGIVLIVMPVTARNRRQSGEWIPISANGGVTFAHGNNPNAMGVFSVPPGLSGRIEDQRQETRQVAEARTGRKMRDGEVSSFWFRQGLRFIKDNPGRWLGLERDKLLFALANDEQPLEYNPRLDRNPFRWLFPVPFALILALAVLRILEAPESRRSESPIFIMIATLFAALLMFYVSGRYRLPAVPALAAIAGWGGSIAIRRFKRSPRGGGLALLLAFSVGAASLAYVPLRYRALQTQQDAMGYLDLGAALWEIGRHEEALGAVRKSIELDPETPERYLDLARLLSQTGRPGEADVAFRKALDRNPSDPGVHFDFGVFLVGQRRLEDAAGAFQNVLRLAPDSTNAANNLLGVQLQLGRTEEARRLLEDLRSRGLEIDPLLEEQLRRSSSLSPPGPD